MLWRRITRGAPTPRIDTLVAEGTRLLNFNVEAQCTPSRSGAIAPRRCYQFALIVRADVPTDAILHGTWTLPNVQRES